MARTIGSISNQPPKYLHHEASGQAYVRLAGRQIYLGKWDTPESREKYDRVVGEWLARGRQAPTTEDRLTVSQMLAATVDLATQDGRHIHGHALTAMRWLRRLYGDHPATKFGPRELLAIRRSLVSEPRQNGGRLVGGAKSRNYTNKIVSYIVWVFKEAARQSLLPGSVAYELSLVGALKAGETSKVRETTAVMPADPRAVDAVIALATPHVAAILKLLRLSTARTGEICIMRTCDLRMEGEVWYYTPSTHKTAHLGKVKTILLGPRAQEVLRPFLKTDLNAYLFSPRENLLRFRERQHDSRRNRKKDQRRWRPLHSKFRNRYTTNSVAQALLYLHGRAEAKAHKERPDVPATQQLVPYWHLHQLRHSGATDIAEASDLEVAQTLLGHDSPRTTRRYAHQAIDRMKMARAESVVARLG